MGLQAIRRSFIVEEEQRQVAEEMEAEYRASIAREFHDRRWNKHQHRPRPAATHPPSTVLLLTDPEPAYVTYLGPTDPVNQHRSRPTDTDSLVAVAPSLVDQVNSQIASLLQQIEALKKQKAQQSNPSVGEHVHSSSSAAGSSIRELADMSDNIANVNISLQHVLSHSEQARGVLHDIRTSTHSIMPATNEFSCVLINANYYFMYIKF